MREQTSSLAAECETVEKIYAAINRNDLPAAMKTFDSQMAWVEPPDDASRARGSGGKRFEGTQ